MMKFRARKLDWPALALASAFLLSGKAIAAGAIIQYEGEDGDRVVYFARIDQILNRTPSDQVFGSTEIREMGVTAVYESAKKPELVYLLLQFQCPNVIHPDGAKVDLSKDKTLVHAGDTVTFRIRPTSYKLRRADLESEPVPETDWKMSNAPMLSRAGTLACNSLELDLAMQASIKQKDAEFVEFKKRMSRLGLPADMQLTGDSLQSEFLDFAWSNLWYDVVLAGKRPDPSGKWAKPLSDADRQAAMAKLKQRQQELESGTASMRASLEADIQQTDAEIKRDLAAAKNAGTHPDGSRMNQREARLAAVFVGQPEQKVIDSMGNPQFNQVAGTHFLRYTESWQKTGVTVYGATGVVGAETGGYAECYAEFRSRPDAKGVWRVDDVLVRADYEGAGLGRASLMCDDVMARVK